MDVAGYKSNEFSLAREQKSLGKYMICYIRL